MSIDVTRILLKNKGFTLVELMMTVAIIGAMVAVAAPNMSGMYSKRQVKQAAEQLYSDINWARSAAVSGNQKIAMSFNTASGEWCYGFRFNTNATCDCTQANSCQKVVNQDDFSGVSFSNMSITNNKLVFNTTPMLSDNTSGGSLNIVNGSKSITMNISLLGRPSMCSNSVSGVPGC